MVKAKAIMQYLALWAISLGVIAFVYLWAN